MSVKRNLKLMKMVDDAWNAQDWKTLETCYAKNVEVHWPDQLDARIGFDEYLRASKAYFNGYPDAHIANNPYKICFGEDDWTCSVSLMTGTNTGPMMAPDGKSQPPTNKSYKAFYCTLARWKENQIAEQWMFYDMASMMRQLGLLPMPSGSQKERAMTQEQMA